MNIWSTASFFAGCMNCSQSGGGASLTSSQCGILVFIARFLQSPWGQQQNHKYFESWLSLRWSPPFLAWETQCCIVDSLLWWLPGHFPNFHYNAELLVLSGSNQFFALPSVCKGSSLDSARALSVCISKSSKIWNWVSVLRKALLGFLGVLVRIAGEMSSSALRFPNTGVSSPCGRLVCMVGTASLSNFLLDGNSHQLHQAISGRVRILCEMHRTKHRCFGRTVPIFPLVVHKGRPLSKNWRTIEWKLV